MTVDMYIYLYRFVLRLGIGLNLCHQFRFTHKTLFRDLYKPMQLQLWVII